MGRIKIKCAKHYLYCYHLQLSLLLRPSLKKGLSPRRRALSTDTSSESILEPRTRASAFSRTAASRSSPTSRETELLHLTLPSTTRSALLVSPPKIRLTSTRRGPSMSLRD